MLAARQRYSEYERKWLRLTLKTGLSQKDLMRMFSAEFYGKKIQQATVNESISRKWAYLDEMSLPEASKERFRRRYPESKRKPQSNCATPSNSNQNSRRDLTAIIPSKGPISMSLGTLPLIHPAAFNRTFPASQLDVLQSTQAASIEDLSNLNQSLSPFLNLIHRDRFSTKFISDYDGMEISNYSTCDSDWILASLFGALEGPFACELRTNETEALFERLEALLNITKDLPIRGEPLVLRGPNSSNSSPGTSSSKTLALFSGPQDLHNSLDIGPLSTFAKLPRRICENLEGNANSVAFSYTNEEARIHFFLQEACCQDAVDMLNWSSDLDNQDTKETFAAKIVLTPRASNPSFSVVLDFQQATERPGNIRLKQSITFRAVIPPESKIFEIVQLGSAHDLQKALANGEVSLNVCDHMGRSPLNYATRGSKTWAPGTARRRLKVCKFLISIMNDVNMIENEPNKDSSFYIYPLDMISSDSSTCLEYLDMLLKKDADPSLPIFGRFFSGHLMRVFPVDALKVLLDLSTPYCSANFTGVEGELAPLYFAMNEFVECDLLFSSPPHCNENGTDCALKVIFLLQRGADINKKWVQETDPDSVHSYLSYVLSSQDIDGRGDERLAAIRDHEVEDLLMILVTAGADVHAMVGHEEQNSCSALIAQDPKRKALWSKVLRNCGYDPEAVFIHHRIPRSSTVCFEDYCRTRVPLRYPPRVEELHTDEEFEIVNEEIDEVYGHKLDLDVVSEKDAEKSDVDADILDVSIWNQAQAALDHDNGIALLPGWDFFEAESFANSETAPADFQLDEIMYSTASL